MTQSDKMIVGQNDMKGVIVDYVPCSYACKQTTDRPKVIPYSRVRKEKKLNVQNPASPGLFYKLFQKMSQTGVKVNKTQNATCQITQFFEAEHYNPTFLCR